MVETNDIAHITDNMGYHKIGNPMASTPAVSLHIYAPPISECRTWSVPAKDDQGGTVAHRHNTKGNGTVAKVVHYSEYGRLVYGSDP
jgi:Cysteine dioxygenase type I